MCLFSGDFKVSSIFYKTWKRNMMRGEEVGLRVSLKQRHRRGGGLMERGRQREGEREKEGGKEGGEKEKGRGKRERGRRKGGREGEGKRKTEGEGERGREEEREKREGRKEGEMK
jgi:hypothetical protein